MKRRIRLKEVCSLLMVLLMTLTLMPAKETRADGKVYSITGRYNSITGSGTATFTVGETCPVCNIGLLSGRFEQRIGGLAACHYIWCDYRDCGARVYEDCTGNATCTQSDTCTVCGNTYYAAHSLRVCRPKDPTCTEIGYKYKCWYCVDCQLYYDNSDHELTDVVIPALGHDVVHHDAKASTCTEVGWEAYDTCSRCDYSTYKEIPALGHDLVHHDAKAATCTEVGWEAYDTCSRCDYTTYKEIPALGHDVVHHDAKAATCTEVGWEAYDTCSRCDYSTYKEIPALGHDLVHLDAKAATCTEVGWEAYDTCSRCDYTTYKEIPMLIEYSVTGGGDSSWTSGSTDGITISVKRSSDDDKTFTDYFTGVKIDDKELLNGTDYTAAPGSVIITIKDSALQNLSVGTHTVTVTFKDGTVVTSIIVKAASSGSNSAIPSTGETISPAFWIGSSCMAVACMLFAVVLIQKKRKSAQR